MVSFPKITGFQIITLLLITLIGLFLGVVSFASFGVLQEINKPIALLNTAIEKLDHLNEQKDLEYAEQKLWRDTVMNDHLFISSIIASHDKQNAYFAKQLNLTSDLSTQLEINGTDLIYNGT